MSLAPKTVPATIILKGDGVFHEAEAAATITPGHLVELDSNGKFALGGTATRVKTVAREDDLQGNDITDNYTSGQNVLAIVPHPGSEVYLIAKDNSGAIAKGADVEFAANGEVSVFSSGFVVGQALEAIDTSDSAVTPLAARRIRVRIS